MDDLARTLPFLKENGYRMLKHIDLGRTSHVFVVEKKKIKYALKVARGAEGGQNEKM